MHTGAMALLELLSLSSNLDLLGRRYSPRTPQHAWFHESDNAKLFRDFILTVFENKNKLRRGAKDSFRVLSDSEESEDNRARQYSDNAKKRVAKSKKATTRWPKAPDLARASSPGSRSARSEPSSPETVLRGTLNDGRQVHQPQPANRKKEMSKWRRRPKDARRKNASSTTKSRRVGREARNGRKATLGRAIRKKQTAERRPCATTLFDKTEGKGIKRGAGATLR